MTAALAAPFLVGCLPVDAVAARATPATRAAPRTVYGVVGPGFTITLKDAAGMDVTHLAPGTVSFQIRDRATNHNFRLYGPGVDRATGVSYEGRQRWTLKLTKGTYVFECVPHKSFMRGSFTVGQATTPTPPPTTPAAFPLTITNVATKLDQPTWVGAPRGGGPDLYVTERKGTILRLAADGTVTTILDLSAVVGNMPTERGLYSLAFHRNFLQNGRVFLNYADRHHHVRVDEITIQAGAYVVGSLRHVIVIPQNRAANHNGGELAFTKDGYLLVSVGDGGGQEDPDRAGQDLHVLSGKILRLNVDAGGPYTVPRGNPFATNPAKGRPEIYATGLRNPFRMNVDPLTGDLYVGDVGQDTYEELDRVRFRKHQPLLNFGWSSFEGNAPFHTQPWAGGRRIDPAYVYRHGDRGCTIMGGPVYRGDILPASWRGVEVFGDSCAGALSTLTWMDGMPMVHAYPHVLPLVVCVGTDSAGELVAATLSGRIVRLGAAPGTTPAP
jgi:glucose/arabinose dehydrogenase